MKKVSVIVPVFNTGEYLEECLESILRQSLKDIEIICVNDGSIDNSLMILRQYEEKYENIKVIDQVNKGPSISRNVAIAESEGKYLYFMDSDDLITSHMLEELWEVCEKEELDILYFSGTSFYESEELANNHEGFMNSYYRKGQYTKVLSGPELYLELRNNNDYYPSPCLQFVRRSFLEESGVSFCENIIHEDNIFTFETILSAKRAFCVNDIYFYRRVRDNSIMTKSVSCANLRGYFVALMRQMEVASKQMIDDVDINQKITLTLRLLYMHVQRIYSELPTDEKTRFYQLCTPYERLFFDAIIVDNINKAKKSEQEIKKLKKKIKKLEKSNSYRIGKAITCPLRILKKVWRSLKKHGVSGTYRRGLNVIKKKIK